MLHLASNLTALRTHFPALAQSLEAALIPEGFAPTTGTDGTPTYARVTSASTGRRVEWLGHTSMPQASAEPLSASLDALSAGANGLGLSIGTGTDVAIEASDLTLVSGDLRAAADAIRLSRRTLATIKGNLFWAFAYNVAALPLAVTGYLNPLVAGAAMAL